MSFKIFYLEPKFFHDIEDMPGAQQEVGVPKDRSSKYNSFNYIDGLSV